MNQVPRHVLPVIVFAQFCCTSLWFAGNGVAGDLITTFQLADGIIGILTSSIQFGFILGTLVFAVLSIADRYSPSTIFLVCAIAGALANAFILHPDNTIYSILIIRFITGFFLAGIYPVGMKIAADYYNQGLGRSLGFLVGALVLGTALPHLLKSVGLSFPWTYVIMAISGLAATGGILLYLLVGDGPHRRAGSGFQFGIFMSVFRIKDFRRAAFGYFGHMWELYAFWAFVPVILTFYNSIHTSVNVNVSLYSFIIIAIGSIGCVTGGYLAECYGSAKVAKMALISSGICCVLSPVIISQDNYLLLIIFLLFWGVVVIADSPLFSTLVAQSASPSTKGTALTIVNCIGFAITIVSIQLLTYLNTVIDTRYILLILIFGPLWGVYNMNQRPVPKPL